MEKKYNPNKVDSEQRGRSASENSELFQELSKKPVSKITFSETILGKRIPANPFVCLLPPPNITGKLHLGHMWNCTIQDILLRFNYLQGRRIKWLIGLDHAGIATQIKVEQFLSSQISQFDVSNYSLNWLKQKGNEWSERHKQYIIDQWKKMGLLMNLKEIAYTLDPKFNKLVVQAFVKLYQDGLIYKGKKMVNWDVKLQTAISDLEVIHKNEKRQLYYLKYPLAENESEFLVVATTRPETCFVDVCLFVNPHDNRYNEYIGKEVINPVNQKKIPILVDEYVDINFGTGVLKCTPGHDTNDYELGIKHSLPNLTCLDKKGYLNKLAGKYQGLERFLGRKRLVHDLQESGILLKTETYESNIGYSQRSNTIIEPYLSTQWFLKYSEWIRKIEEQQGRKFAELLAEMEFCPDEYKYRLIQWEAKLRDWCLSRQLWWGHRIPAWYNKKSGEIYVAENPPVDIENWEPEKMVLDTWFSSGLAPLFYSDYLQENKKITSLPITFLATAYDILFFWVFKMICFSYYFAKKKPFSNVLIHGLIRDASGNKMSKSLGNVIDPETLIEKYGTDATRLTFVVSQIQDQDIRVQENKLKGNWRFLNKLWNIAYCLNDLKKKYDIKDEEVIEFTVSHLSHKITDKYLEKDYLSCYFLFIFRNLVSKPYNKKNSYNALLNENKISEVADKLKKFIICDADDELTKKLTELGIRGDDKRDDFGNDYLEILKLTTEKSSIKAGLILFKYFLTLLNPFAPFITQKLYKELYSESLLLSARRRERVLLAELVKNLENDNLEGQGIRLMFTRNSEVMYLFYRIIRKVREFRKRYSLNEKLIINLYLLSMSNIDSNEEPTYLTIDESYKGIDWSDVKEKFNIWLKKLVDTELNEITLSKVELYEEYEKKRKKLEKERSVKCLKERISLYAGRLKIFIPKDSFLQFEKKNKDIKEKETKETILFLKREIARCEKLLSDEGFKQKAPKELIEKETKKLTKLRTYYEKLKSEV